MELNFEKAGGLITVIVQDAKSLKVLMVGFMNPEALEITKSTGNVTFFSRTKNRLWTKGETSGNFLVVKEIKIDCDKDTLLIMANPVGPACHTGADTCFFEENNRISNVFFLNKLESIINNRKLNPDENSYTTKLFSKGINKVAQKVGEEAVELVIEAKDENNRELFLGEAADLLFHYMVLLQAKNYTLGDVMSVLESRHK
jgi:phosphoribosyl-ATP pyrophosphohydrolase/phosphoribosyl-AMP cyclohydrolase